MATVTTATSNNSSIISITILDRLVPCLMLLRSGRFLEIRTRRAIA